MRWFQQKVCLFGAIILLPINLSLHVIGKLSYVLVKQCVNISIYSTAVNRTAMLMETGGFCGLVFLITLSMLVQLFFLSLSFSMMVLSSLASRGPPLCL